MDEGEQVLGLIGDIYDAALDRSSWPEVLRRVALFVGGVSAAVFWKDAAYGSGDVYFHDGGIEDRFIDLYFGKYVQLDPTSTRQFFSGLEEPVTTSDLIPYDEFLQSRFYREWAQPQGLVDFVSAALEKSATSAAMFGVFRHESHGIADEETRRRMRLLIPHIRRAVFIAKVVDLKQIETETIAQTLDGLRAATFLVDKAGRIAHANSAGHAALGRADLLRAAGGHLVASDPQTDRNLQEALAAAAQGDAALATRGIALSMRTSVGDHYVAHVLPLTSGKRHRAGFGQSATAAVFVQKAVLDFPPPPEAIAKAFRLTPTELRVLLAIVEVGGVPEVADVLGVADSTVKTHLGRIYEKTGIGRQADLVRLVAGFSSPLLH